MKIRNKRLSSVTTDVRGTYYDFVNFECDMPIQDALTLLRSHEYENVDPIPQFNPESWLNERKLLWNGPFGRENGFGNFSEQMMLAMSRQCDLYAIDTWNLSKQYPERYERETLNILNKKLDRLDVFHIKVSLYHDPEPMPIDYTIGYTMFETTRIPDDRVPTCNAATRIWVPCRQNVQSFTESGVRVPIDKIPLGFNPTYYKYIDRPIKKKSEPFVFGIFGGLTRRKGVYEVIEAFRSEFTHGENVKLISHNVKPVIHGWEYGDPRIEHNLVPWGPEELAKEFIGKMDCAVFPTKGEGFGLPPIEAAATGCPTIVTNWSGPAEYAKPEYFKLLDAELEPVFDFPAEWGYLGDWAKIDIRQLRRYMRWMYENRAEAKEMGRKASEYLHTNWTWDKAATRAINKLDELTNDIMAGMNND